MSTTDTKYDAQAFEAAFDQLGELGEQFVAASRKAGNLYLDAYEKTVDRAVDLELKLAGLTKQEWLKDVIEAQADIAREIADSYTKTARSLLK